MIRIPQTSQPNQRTPTSGTRLAMIRAATAPYEDPTWYQATRRSMRRMLAGPRARVCLGGQFDWCDGDRPGFSVALHAEVDPPPDDVVDQAPLEVADSLDGA